VSERLGANRSVEGRPGFAGTSRAVGGLGGARGPPCTEMAADTLRVGITCYPSVGGSGVLATALGEDLAARGHDVHFIAYERPFRLPSDASYLHFHPVSINYYALFRFPNYTLPLPFHMAQISRDHHLDWR